MCLGIEGRTGCDCNALFAVPYKEGNSGTGQTFYHPQHTSFSPSSAISTASVMPGLAWFNSVAKLCVITLGRRQVLQSDGPGRQIDMALSRIFHRWISDHTRRSAWREVAYEPWELCNLRAQGRRAPRTHVQAQQDRRRHHQKQQPRAGFHGGKDPWARHGEAS